MADSAKPWDAVFRRIRALYWPDCTYPPKPTSRDFEVAEEKLNFKFPDSYRAFAEEFGLGGELHRDVKVLPLSRPPWPHKSDRLASVLDSTEFFRAPERQFTGWDDPAPATFLLRVITFAEEGGGSRFVFDPLEVVSTRPREYRIYEVQRGNHAEAVAASFGEWLDWVDRCFRFEAEDEEERSEPKFPPVFKPDSSVPDAMVYQRHTYLLPRKKAPAKKNVKLWLAFNNHTVRDLALSIRDRGQTDAFPILADALQEAGCTNADLLDSCRTGDPEIDGKWVLQVLLGKA